MTNSLISLRSVSKIFPGPKEEHVVALDDMNIEVSSGDYLSLIGPSGSGKSTLLFTIGGLMKPSSGIVRFVDMDVYELSSGERAKLRQRRIGFMFQTFNLMPYLNCRENVMLPALIAGTTHDEAQSYATQLLGRLGLNRRHDHRPHELSVGERQRAALARALVNRPDVLLVDEPTGNLDPAMTEEIITLLQEANAAGQTIVMVTHDHRLAARTKRVIKLINGKINWPL